jgi:hypothetical protein
LIFKLPIEKALGMPKLKKPSAKLGSSVKTMMKKAQYRKYKEIYEVDLDIIKNVIKDCDVKLNEINNMIDKKNKKQKGGEIHKIKSTDKIYLLIPSI